MSDGEHDISWALNLLEPQPYSEPSFLRKHWFHVFVPMFSLSIPFSINLWLRRPAYAGIQRYVLCGALGVGASHLLTERERSVLAKRDARLRHYIRLHPEDFPPPARYKYGELFRPWVPVR